MYLRIEVCFPYEFTLLSNDYDGVVEDSVVCFPYEFTLLSNGAATEIHTHTVCFPYEFTLLSNVIDEYTQQLIVCFSYEFTLLSNFVEGDATSQEFVSPTNLHCSQTVRMLIVYLCSLFPLRIYTALKQDKVKGAIGRCLFPLRIYTALKHA